jgi:hypothetical protein
MTTVDSGQHVIPDAVGFKVAAQVWWRAALKFGVDPVGHSSRAKAMVLAAHGVDSTSLS